MPSEGYADGIYHCPKCESTDVAMVIGIVKCQACGWASRQKPPDRVVRAIEGTPTTYSEARA